MAKVDLANLPGRGIKPLVSFKAHKRVALIAFLVTFLGGIPLVFIKGQTFYSTSALLLITPRYMKNLRDDGEIDFPSNSQYREYLQQQIKTITRYDIVRDALIELGDKAGNWHKPNEAERRSIDRLRSSLVVQPVHDTYMIEITLQAKEKESLAEVINAIVDIYIQRARSERVFGANTRIQMLKDRENEVLNTIREITSKRSELALKMGIATFSSKEENPYNKIVANLRSSIAEARNKRLEAEAQLQIYETTGETDLKTRSIQDALSTDTGLSTIKSNLLARRAEYFSQISGLQPDHPYYQELNAQINRVDNEINTQTNKTKAELEKNMLVRLKIGVEQARRAEADLRKDLDETEKTGAENAWLYNQVVTLTYDLEQQIKELDAVRNRLNIFASEENSFGFVRLVTPALPPEIPYGPGKKKILLIVIAAGLLMMIVIPIVIDLLDRRIQTVNDAEKIMGIPALGWMVERSDEATTLFSEGLLRSMAGSLINEQQKQGTRVFAVTSVKPGGGASDLVLLLTKTLNLLGYRALAVEANAFHTDNRYIGDQPGLAECLRGTVRPSDCIIPAHNDLPARVHVGNVGGKLHLDQIEHVARITKTWAEEFNFVLVDLPPLLLSADAEILTRELQQLLVVVEANGIIAGELRRAKRQLEKLDPNAVGILVNRVRPFEGGGYLQGMLLEYLSGRKLPDYYTTPQWMVNLKAQWIGLQLRYPKLILLAEYLQSIQTKLLAIFAFQRKAPGKNLSIEEPPKHMQKLCLSLGTQNSSVFRRWWRKWLITLTLLLMITGISYFLIKRPDLWVSFLSDVIPSRFSARLPADTPLHIPSPSQLKFNDVTTLSSSSISATDMTSHGYSINSDIPRQSFIVLGRFLQYIVPIAFAFGGVISFLARRRQTEPQTQISTNPNLRTLEMMPLSEFKELVTEAFRDLNYRVIPRGGDAPDLSLDLELYMGNNKYLVQCKQWKADKVGVTTIHNLYDTMAKECAVGGFVIALGTFTDAARSFAENRSIKLISPESLLQTLKETGRLATEEPSNFTTIPRCPECGSKMVRRELKKGNMAGLEFWGCSSHPTCRGIRA